MSAKEAESKSLQIKRDALIAELREVSGRIYALSDKVTKYPLYMAPTGEVVAELAVPDYGLVGVRAHHPHHPGGAFIPVNLELLSKAVDNLRLNDRTQI